MYVFAVLSDPELPLDLTEDRYNQVTHREYPYVRNGSDGKPKHYALCPECQNPIQLVNRSVPSTESVTLYAKHIKVSLPDLADYDQAAYDDCQLANPHRLDAKTRRKSGKKTNKIKEVFTKYIDLVVNYAESITGIKFSAPIIDKMISDFCKSKGYEYRAVSEHNIPLAFLYMTEAKSLYGCNVSKVIADEINKNSKSFEAFKFSNGNRFGTKRKPGIFQSELKFFFSGHTIPKNEEDISEHAWLYIVETNKGELPENAPIIVRKKIALSTAKFSNDINRRMRLHQMAKSYLE